jgi:ribonuclease III
LVGLLSRFRGSNELASQVYRVTGVKPGKLRIYQEALRHSSMSDHNDVEQIRNNERLEFLGDAVLDAVVAELLFKQFPNKNEGFLTEMRTRIVNREQLAYLASKLGLVEIMDIKRDLHQNRIALKTIGGNALEALIGAIYLDKGFKTSRDFVVNRLVGQYLDIEKLMTTAVSHKALVMKWAQQQKKVLRFQHDVTPDRKIELHVVTLFIDEEAWFTEENHSRKKAEELCCEKAVRKLNLTV